MLLIDQKSGRERPAAQSQRNRRNALATPHLPPRESHLLGADQGQQIAAMGEPAMDLKALRRLSVSERIQLVEDLWDSIA